MKFVIPLLILSCLILAIASAPAAFIYNSPNSSALISGGDNKPANDPLEFIVNPGDTLYLGKTYDLRKVYGFNGQFAWWSDWRIENTDCSPDLIIDTSYIKTNGKVSPDAVYLDPSQWKTGDWFQWNGCFDQYVAGQTTPNNVPYSQDNNYVFTIINAPVPRYDPGQPINYPVIISTQPKYVTQEIPVQYMATTIPGKNISVIPISTPVTVQEQGWPWYIYVFIIMIIGSIVKILFF